MTQRKTPGLVEHGAGSDDLGVTEENVPSAPPSRTRTAKVFIAAVGSSNRWGWAVVCEGYDVPPPLVARRLSLSQDEAFRAALTVLSIKLYRRIVAQVACLGGSRLHRAVKEVANPRIKAATSKASPTGALHAENLARAALDQLTKEAP